MKPLDIFMTTWNRQEFTDKAIALLHERTPLGNFRLHVYDNNSNRDMREYLTGLLNIGCITSLHLDNRNTGCLYNKGIFHMMTESDQKYYCITDNDIYPPKLSPDWLSQMVEIMDAHPDLAFLTPQVPPQWLQKPGEIIDDIVYCEAVGNTFKLVRRKAFPIEQFKPALEAYGDDGLVCDLVKLKNYKSAFCRNIFCYHAGQCDGWGYKKEEIDMDPRKAGYGKPFSYELANKETYEPVSKYKI